MAILKAFRGLRPPEEIVQDLASRPYDVLNSDEAREEAKGNPYSLLHIIKPEIDLPAGIDVHTSQVYDKARENFRLFREKGTATYPANLEFANKSPPSPAPPAPPVSARAEFRLAERSNHL